MCREENMGIAPWGSLGSGHFKSEEQRKQEGAAGRQTQPNEKDLAVSKALESIATRKNTAITSIALAYVMHKAPCVFPIVGGRKVDHLKGNIAALTLRLTQDDINEIEKAYPFELGFPHYFLWGAEGTDHPQNVALMNMCGTFDYVPQVPVRVILSCWVRGVG